MSFRVISQSPSYKQTTSTLCLINKKSVFINRDDVFKDIYFAGDVTPEDFLYIPLIANGFNNPLPARVVFRLLTSTFKYPFIIPLTNKKLP